MLRLDFRLVGICTEWTAHRRRNNKNRVINERIISFSIKMFDMIPLNRQIGFNSTINDLLVPRMRIRGTIHFVNYPNSPL